MPQAPLARPAVCAVGCARMHERLAGARSKDRPKVLSMYQAKQSRAPLEAQSALRVCRYA